MNAFCTGPFYYVRRERNKNRDTEYSSWLKNLCCDCNVRTRYEDALFCRNRDNPRQPYHCRRCRTECAMKLQHHSLWSMTRCPSSLAEWPPKWSVTITWLPWILSSWWPVIKSKHWTNAILSGSSNILRLNVIASDINDVLLPRCSRYGVR